MTKPLVVGIVGAGFTVNNAYLPALVKTKDVKIALLSCVN